MVFDTEMSCMYAIIVILLEDIKDGSRLKQRSARLYCEFHFKIKHDTELNKIIFMKNKNLTHNHPINEKIYKNYSFVRNKELVK